MNQVKSVTGGTSRLFNSQLKQVQKKTEKLPLTKILTSLNNGSGPTKLKLIKISPNTQYKKQLTLVRKTYYQESLERQEAAKKAALLKLEQEKEKRAALEADIRTYKQSSQFLDEDHFDSAQSSKIKNDDLKFSSLSQKSNQPFDPLLHERKVLWKEYQMKVKEQRTKNYENTLTKQSNKRLEKLLYLFY